MALLTMGGVRRAAPRARRGEVSGREHGEERHLADEVARADRGRHDLVVPARRREEQRRDPVVVRLVDGRARGDQRRHDLVVAVLRRDAQRLSLIHL